MRALLALLLVIAAFSILSATADAHTCQGMNCGPCVQNEMHQHQDAHGRCSSGPGYFTNEGYGGQSASVPASGAALAIVGVALVALLVGRRA